MNKSNWTYVKKLNYKLQLLKQNIQHLTEQGLTTEYAPWK